MRRFLTFDDVGLVPKFNKIVSRLHTDLKTQIGKDSFKSPFILSLNDNKQNSNNLKDLCSKFLAAQRIKRYRNKK